MTTEELDSIREQNKEKREKEKEEEKELPNVNSIFVNLLKTRPGNHGASTSYSLNENNKRVGSDPLEDSFTDSDSDFEQCVRDFKKSKYFTQKK